MSTSDDSNDPSYQQASMRALGRTFGELYAGLLESGVPEGAALKIVKAYVRGLTQHQYGEREESS